MLPYLFVLIAIAWRFLVAFLRFSPGTIFNFAPLGASLLFFGARGPRKYIWAPFVLMAVADVILTRVVYHYALLPDQLATWAWYAVALWIGTRLRKGAKPVRLVGASLVASLSFFVISNLAFWADGDMYPHTWEGLQMCYVAALPFFRSTLVSDLVFTLVFFGVAALLHSGAGEEAPARRNAA